MSLQFDWQKRPAKIDVISAWQSVELEPDNLFLSIDWITAWLHTCEADLWMLSIRHKGSLVGVGLWVHRKHRRKLGIRTSTLHLLHTGQEKSDQIWPEYSAIRVRPEYKEACYGSLISNIFAEHPDINEIDVGLMATDDIGLLNVGGLLLETYIETKSYQLNMDVSSLEDVLSAGFKAQVRRSAKGLSELSGEEIQPHFEMDRDKCWQILGDIKPHHIAAWGETSGFHNDEFVAFHHRLILQGGQDVEPLMACLYLGDRLLGANYLLKQGKQLYFYLGVSDKTLGSRIKVGNYLHTQTIAAMKNFGTTLYDFLGGDYSYKARMSNQSKELARLRIKRPMMQFRIEQLLKKIKQGIER